MLSADGKRLLRFSSRDSYDQDLAVGVLGFAREREDEIFVRNAFLGSLDGFEPSAGRRFDAVVGIAPEVHRFYRVQVEFTLWCREVEEEWPDPDTYVDDLYDAASAELPRIVAQLESGALGARLEPSEEDLTDGADYIDHTAWRPSGKVLLAGVKHGDTEAPVQLVVVVREPSEGAEGDEGEWL
ncbi:hypothetical protein [Streptomyces sp. P17]|uniref:hypothetical protein n=1 Tax=Streptomyces sp. P17 TaxID=3074716 RepID=UPI0028F3ECDD|nr:hypothetical protein [Streptomyces sp. P17]